MASIVGICLVKNEEYFITWALMNVLEFCDNILIMDNLSDDLTGEIIRCIAEEHHHIDVIQVPDPNNTHKFLEHYFGTDTWMLKVDGDEIYDPKGLAKLRTKLLAGEFDPERSIGSYMVHVVGIDFENGHFSAYQDKSQGGYLLNCNAVVHWDGQSERLHASNVEWHPDYEKNLHVVSSHQNWDNSEFRCMHMCFWPRSSSDRQFDRKNTYSSRWNPREMKHESTMFRRIRRAISPYYTTRPDYKNKIYRNGDIQNFYDLADFGRPDDFPLLNPKGDEIVNLIDSISKYRKTSGRMGRIP